MQQWVKKRVVEDAPLVLYTLAYYLSFFGIGIYYSVCSVTLPSLSILLSSSVSDTGFVLTTRGIGMLISALLVGFLYEKCHLYSASDKQWYSLTLNKIMIGFQWLLALFVVLVPFVPWLWLMCVLFFCSGVVSAALEIGCYLGINLLWRQRVAPVQQGLQSFFGLANLLYPIFAAQAFSFITFPVTQVLFCYLLAATVIYFPTLLLVFFPTPLNVKKDSPAEKKESEMIEKKEDKTPSNCSPGIDSLDVPVVVDASVPSSQPVVLAEAETPKRMETGRLWKLVSSLFTFENCVCLMCGLMKLFFVGNTVGFAGLLYSFGTRKKLDTPANLSYLMSIYFALFTASRVLFAFLSTFIKPLWILLFSFSSVLLVHILWLIFSQSTVFIWIASLSFAFCCSPSSAAIINLPQVSFGAMLSSPAVAMIMFLQYVGEMLSPTIFTFFTADSVLGVDSFPWISLGNIVISCCLLISTIVLERLFNPNRKKGKPEGSKDVAAITPRPQDVDAVSESPILEKNEPKVGESGKESALVAKSE